VKTKHLSVSASNTCVSETHQYEWCNGKMPKVRRSLTIVAENDDGIQNIRGMFLGLRSMPVDIDYTSAINMILELGRKLFMGDWSKSTVCISTKELMEIAAKYTINMSTKTDSVFDQVQDWFVQNLPNMIAQYQKSQAISVDATSLQDKK